MTLGFGLPAMAIAAIDLAFPVVFAVAIGREIVAGRNWRNLKVLALLILLIIADLLFHIEAAQGGYAAGGLGARLALATLILLIKLIGGRIVPSFTRNWLAQRRSSHLPAQADRIDDACMAMTIAALLAWVALPDHGATGALCLVAGIANVWRLLRWRRKRHPRHLRPPLRLPRPSPPHRASRKSPRSRSACSLSARWASARARRDSSP